MKEKNMFIAKIHLSRVRWRLKINIKKWNIILLEISQFKTKYTDFKFNWL